MKSLKIIFRKSRVLFCSLFVICLGASIGASELYAQNETEFKVVGTIVDAHTKEPLPAVQIGTLSLSASALSDELGAFEILLKDKNDVLLISAFDYDIIEVPVRGRTELVVKLYPESFSNNYNLIDGIKGRDRKSYQTNAITQVDEIDRAGALSADDVIINQLGGSVRSLGRSGNSGIGASMFIRGIHSINANSQPLFIVDGIVWDNLTSVYSIHQGNINNPLLDIDVNDIASISVVRDGTAIYGAKAANGVIIINTKRGEDVVTKIDVNLMTGITQTPSSFPVMSGDDYRIYTGELLSSNSNISIKQIGTLDFLNDDKSTPFYNKYHNSTDWNDKIYQLGRTDGYSVSVNGGDSRALYYFSVGYTGNKGVVKNTDMERLNIRYNADFKFAETFDLGLQLAFTSVDRNLMDDGVSDYTSPTYISSIKSPFLSPFLFTNDGDITLDYADGDEFGVSNPSALIKNSKNKSKQYRFNLGLSPTLRITPDITISDNFDYSLYRTKEAYFISPDGFPEIDYNLEEPITSITSGQMYRNVTLYNDLKVNYKKELGNNTLDIDLGTRFIFNDFESNASTGYNAPAKDPFVNSGLLGISLTPKGSAKNINVANYLSLKYDYDKRFFLTATSVLEGSNRFGKEVDGTIDMLGQSWGLFPSVNAAWLMSSENFMKSINCVNYLKLRAGYDITGNDDIQSHVRSSYFYPQYYAYTATGMVISSIGNQSVKWEETSKVSGGAEMGLFNNRIALSVDVFSSTTKDLLTLKELPDISGLDYYWTNEGEMTNKGYEFAANIKALNLKNFQWEVGLNVGHYKNKITSLPNNKLIEHTVYDGTVASVVGASVGAFYGYKTTGVLSTTADAETANLSQYNSASQLVDFTAGDMHFVDKLTVDTNNDGIMDAGDGIIDENDREIIGDPNPDFYGSFNSRFTYKKFSLNALFTYSYGNDIYNYVRQTLEQGVSFRNQSTAMLNRWSYEGQVTDQPKAVYGDPMDNGRFSDRWIEDGSYLKFKSLTVSYDLELKNSKIAGINIWAAANNLVTFTDYLGLDPEVSTNNAVLYQGVDAGLLPSAKSFFIGVKLSL